MHESADVQTNYLFIWESINFHWTLPYFCSTGEVVNWRHLDAVTSARLKKAEVQLEWIKSLLYVVVEIAISSNSRRCADQAFLLLSWQIASLFLLISLAAKTLLAHTCFWVALIEWRASFAFVTRLEADRCVARVYVSEWVRARISEIYTKRKLVPPFCRLFAWPPAAARHSRLCERAQNIFSHTHQVGRVRMKNWQFAYGRQQLCWNTGIHLT